MKFTKSLAAILICGSFVVINCDVVEAAQSTESSGISSEKISDLNTDSLQIEELAFGPGRRRPYPPPPPPPPPPPGWDRHHHGHHHPHHGHRPPPPPPPPHHGW